MLDSFYFCIGSIWMNQVQVNWFQCEVWVGRKSQVCCYRTSLMVKNKNIVFILLVVPLFACLDSHEGYQCAVLLERIPGYPGDGAGWQHGLSGPQEFSVSTSCSGGAALRSNHMAQGFIGSVLKTSKDASCRPSIMHPPRQPTQTLFPFLYSLLIYWTLNLQLLQSRPK